MLPQEQSCGDLFGDIEMSKAMSIGFKDELKKVHDKNTVQNVDPIKPTPLTPEERKSSPHQKMQDVVNPTSGDKDNKS